MTKAAPTTTELRRICRRLPEVTEKPFSGHRSPAFRVRDKIFVMMSEDRRSVTMKAASGVQQMLVASDPERFFVPRYVGPKGWVGVHVGPGTDWTEVGELVEDSYRLVAPKRLVALLDGPG
jgi:hypothetical protein